MSEEDEEKKSGEGTKEGGRGKGVVEKCGRVRVRAYGEKSKVGKGREGKKRMRGGRWKEREWSV